MSSYVTNSGLVTGNNRLKKLDSEGKTSNQHLFRVYNHMTEVETLVPGGAIPRFLNQDYDVEYIGENKPGVVPPDEPEAPRKNKSKAVEIPAATEGV